MTIKLYTLPSSTSSRKVKAFLIDNNIAFTEQNMVQDPLTWEQLFEILMCTENGVEDILSTRSKDYEALTRKGVDFDKLKLTELYNVVKNHPKLLKCPIMVSKGTTMVGYNDEEISMLINRDGKKKAFLEVLDAIRLDEDKTIGKTRKTEWDEAMVG